MSLVLNVFFEAFDLIECRQRFGLDIGTKCGFYGLYLLLREALFVSLAIFWQFCLLEHAANFVVYLFICVCHIHTLSELDIILHPLPDLCHFGSLSLFDVHCKCTPNFSLLWIGEGHLFDGITHRHRRRIAFFFSIEGRKECC